MTRPGGPRLGWREWTISGVIPLVLGAAAVWRIAVLDAGDRLAVTLLSVAVAVVGAAWAGRAAYRSMRARLRGEPQATDPRARSWGLAAAISGALAARLFLPDSLVPLLLAAGAGITAAGLPAYWLATRRGR